MLYSTTFDLERNINTSTLRIVVPPKLGKAGVRQAHTDSKADYRWEAGYIVGIDDKLLSYEVCGAHFRCDTTGILWYESTTVSRDSLVYEICDISSRCDTATVHIHAGLADCTITGTNGNDNLYGTKGDDIICGLAGDDTIYGGRGNDIIHSGLEDDVISGNSGSNILYGGLGLDTINESNGNKESGHNDAVYYDPIDINAASEGLSRQEKEYINAIILLCNREASWEDRIPRSVLTELWPCSESIRDLCWSRIALEAGKEREITQSQRVVMNFLCKAASLAEKTDLGYILQTRFRGIFNINTFGYSLVFNDFRELVESDA